VGGLTTVWTREDDRAILVATGAGRGVPARAPTAAAAGRLAASLAAPPAGPPRTGDHVLARYTWLANRLAALRGGGG